MISWIMWKLLMPFDWLIELAAARMKQKDEPKKEQPQLFSHVVWSTLTKTGPLGQYVCSKEDDHGNGSICQRTN